VKPKLRVLYAGKKPMCAGINRAKRLAAKQDASDRKIVLAKFGSRPKTAQHHSELVRQRHESIHRLTERPA
jgi:hypothetical protein